MDPTPQLADRSFPHDRHGNEVKKGHTASFVFGGDHLFGEVHHIETDEHGTHIAHVKTTVKVPARALTVGEAQEASKPHTDEQKQGKAASEPKKAVEHPTHPAPHTTHTDQERSK